MRDYDPGGPWDDYDRDRGRADRRRRSRGHWDHPDDAWAAAHEDAAPPDDGLEAEDFAAGYVGGDDPARRDVDDDAWNPFPDTERMRRLREQAEQRPTRELRIRNRYDRSQIYARSPSYRRSQQGLPERAGPMSADDFFRPPDTRPQSALNLSVDVPIVDGIPYWGVLILVILGIVAVLGVALAIAALVVLLH